MSKLYFITGNEGKFREFKKFIPEIEQIDLDLPEVQSLDPIVVINDKLANAMKRQTGKFIVEDTSLYLNGLNGFPGPLIKWLLQAVGNEGIYSLTQKINDHGAIAKTVIGYVDDEGKLSYFSGEVSGKIVAPVSEPDQGFGWDSIFQPDGLNETFAEMGNDLKSEFSHRTDAIKKFLTFLEG